MSSPSAFAYSAQPGDTYADGSVQTVYYYVNKSLAQVSADLGRSYNHPHVAAGHWVLYRLARDRVGLVTRRDWRWYLDGAQPMMVAMMRDGAVLRRVRPD